jgi:hypothetical protein
MMTFRVPASGFDAAAVPGNPALPGSASAASFPTPPCVVVFQGLASAPEFNGRCGWITESLSARERYKVVVSGVIGEDFIGAPLTPIMYDEHVIFA